MKINRSTKCSLKFLTEKKRHTLLLVLKEYQRVVNFFINRFWDNPSEKKDLLRDIVNTSNSWLSCRIKQCAAREALDMISSTKEAFEVQKEQLSDSIDLLKNIVENIEPTTRQKRHQRNKIYKAIKRKKMKLEMRQIKKPVHHGKRMCLSSNCVNFSFSELSKEFDAWLHLHSVGQKIIFDIPIKLHKHFNELRQIGKRCNYYIISPEYVQFSFEIETGPKKDARKCIGIDSGINALASLSTGEQLGKDCSTYIEKIKRRKYGSKSQKRARQDLKQFVSRTAKEVVPKADLIVVEKLKDLNKFSTFKGRMNKSNRSSIGSWIYSYWLDRLEQTCQRNRVTFRRVSPYYTSQKCPTCGHTDRKNRSKQDFRCQACDYTGNADVTAARNILDRFVTGAYGPGCKTQKKEENSIL